MFWSDENQYHYKHHLILIIHVLIIVPKIIKGIKEGIVFAGRFIGWAIAACIFFIILKSILI
jgi:hypothetical protein